MGFKQEELKAELREEITIMEEEVCINLNERTIDMPDLETRFKLSVEE